MRKGLHTHTNIWNAIFFNFFHDSYHLPLVWLPYTLYIYTQHVQHLIYDTQYIHFGTTQARGIKWNCIILVFDVISWHLVIYCFKTHRINWLSGEHQFSTSPPAPFSATQRKDLPFLYIIDNHHEIYKLVHTVYRHCFNFVFFWILSLFPN